jgi:hypothetical protein
VDFNKAEPGWNVGLWVAKVIYRGLWLLEAESTLDMKYANDIVVAIETIALLRRHDSMWEYL